MSFIVSWGGEIRIMVNLKETGRSTDYQSDFSWIFRCDLLGFNLRLSLSKKKFQIFQLLYKHFEHLL